MTNKLPKKRFRTEIEGLRAVAALLVAIYHIWMGTVSGGVDVFFVVSGFLITTSLLSRFERNHAVDFFGFILRLAKRLFPIGFLVLFVITVANMLWLPHIQWEHSVKEAFASALYFENWQLATNAIDYLAQHNEASPYQHYWAMSVQGQFYLLWPLLLALAILLAKYIFKRSVRQTFLYVIIGASVLSFGYSIYITAVNQPWAYFDTFARVWEFGVGGIAALLLSQVKLGKAPSFLLGWIGLFAIVSCGIIFQVSSVFPGYAAMWPILSAICIIVAGNHGGKFGVHSFLGAKPLVKLGSISYGLYLWHWPVLIFYLIFTGKENVPILDGILLILLSILLAFVSTRLIEKPIRGRDFSPANWKSWGTIATLLIPVLLTAGIWNGMVEKSNAELAVSLPQDTYPGAMAFAMGQGEEAYTGEVPIMPSPLQSRSDLPKIYDDGCHQRAGDADVIECEYGVTDQPAYTIALVGGSHSAHWLPALEAIAAKENIHILSYTKSGCRFSTSEDAEEDCQEWNQNLLDILVKQKLDLVFTTATLPNNKYVPEDYVAQWQILDDAGIDVFAIRDTPWFSFDIAACVDEYGPNASKCSVPREEVIPVENPWEELEQPPKNVTYLDLTDYFCGETECKPVVGNMLIYRDHSHITATYAETLAPMLFEDFMTALKN
ncbi:acyltransferase [Ornithinibacillus gellani]|uniref:acyltransferase family protein n=1 Tax=Ornithinibacillus gellani TaxID=2293253 RepID=UPI000F461D81|nr:acyltransferase family protein [Ornithinibacillus gellani]TQS75943.1 acyltransferase [Ornithinibacillus gellani]